MSFSPQDLGHDEYEECARVVSLVMYKYDFPRDNLFYSASAITDGIAKIPGPSTSTFRFNVDDLKVALANRSIRKSIKMFFNGRIDYQRSNMNEDTIFEGDRKFSNGYQIMFRARGINRETDIRGKIASLRDSLWKL
jgi:hypothetical protein